MANPIISRTELAVGASPMTVNGVVKKTSLLLGISAVTGAAYFAYALIAGFSAGVITMSMTVSIFAAFGLGLFITFKPHMAKSLAVPYAMIEGVLVGAVSLWAASISPSLPISAMSATFVTAAVMLGLYSSGVIKVTDKFRSIVTSAVIAIAIVYGIQWMLHLLFSSTIPYLFDGGIVAIGFSLFVILIASFNLLLNFDSVEKGVAARVSDDFEWVFSIGILATLVWMYLEFVRLLSYFND